MSRVVRVSEHALVRYLDRVWGVDTEAARAELAALAQPAVDRGCHYFETGSLSLALRDEHVLTVINRDERL